MGLLRDRSLEFEQAGVHVFAVSRDAPYTHIAWAQALDLTFPLLSDWNGEAVEGFGIAHEHRGMKGVARRSAFLIDGEGTIRATWLYESAQVPDLDELLAAARALSGRGE
jgi:glutaredoxin-dependent peroxiredoxin